MSERSFSPAWDRGGSSEPVVITRRGRPIARLVPVDDAPASLFGAARGSVKIIGDIIDPIDVKWEAAQ